MASAFDIPLSEETVSRARRGDRGAQESVYRLFERAVYSLARRMTGDPDAASDVTQDTFMKAFERMHQYRGDAPFGMWLRTVAASEALMHLRRGRYFNKLFTTDEGVLETVRCEDVEDSDLEHALSLVDSVPRSVLWLYHVEGYTHAEIGKLCGKTASFSKSQLARAQAKLRTLLNGTPRPDGARSTQEIDSCTSELARMH